MLTIRPTGAVLGATIEGVDLSRPLGDEEFAEALLALGRYGVLRFPDQELDSPALKAFAARFGDLQGSISGDSAGDGELPGVGLLSNIRENGRYIGSPDAGHSRRDQDPAEGRHRGSRLQQVLGAHAAGQGERPAAADR